MLTHSFRIGCSGGILVINTVALAQTKPTQAPNKLSAQGNWPTFAIARSAARSRRSVPSTTRLSPSARLAKSPRLSRTAPMSTTRSALITGPGRRPPLSRLSRNGSMSSCKPAQAPAPVVQQRVNSFNKPYNLVTNNCQQAASKATKK